MNNAKNENARNQQGSTFHERTINSNPILERIIKEESAVKKIIYNTIECRNVRQSSFLNVEDIFQDICLLAMDAEKIARRANKLNTHFYGSIKMFAIDCVLKEQRRLNRFKMTKKGMVKVTRETITNEQGEAETVINKQYISIDGWEHNKRLSHPSFSHRSDAWLTIQQTLSAEDFEIFTLHYSGFTIAEISQRMGKACQYALTKIKNILAVELSE